MDSNQSQFQADETCRIFARRATELGLWVWVRNAEQIDLLQPQDSIPKEWSAPEPELADKLASELPNITTSTHPIHIDKKWLAAWIPLINSDSTGFVVAAPYEPESTLLLTQAQRMLSWTLEDMDQISQGEYAVNDLADQLGQCYENITLLYDIGRSMREVDTPRIVAENICDQIRLTQGFAWSAVCVDASEREISGMANNCLLTGELPCDEHKFAKAASQLIDQWDEAAGHKLLQVGEHELSNLVDSETMIEPVMRDGSVVGLVIAGGKTGDESEATSGDRQLLDAVAGFLGALHENTARLIEQKEMFIGSLKAVSAALDAKDRYTHGHSERVAWLGSQLAKSIGLSDEQVERIRISGLVHDVGKIGVPEAVLCKTGRLTDEEFEQIKKHPRIGYNILKDIPGMEDVLDGVLYHHERWDGRGYPTNIAGEEIPIYGRILAVADTFDAMSSTRSYRKAMPREKVLAEILNCAGTQFDPTLTDPFVAIDFTEYDAMVARHQGNAIDTQAEPAERAA